MTREFLKNLGIEGLTDEIIGQIMEEHGKTVNSNKLSAEESMKALRKQLEARAEITPEKLGEINTQLSALEQKLKAFDGVNVEELRNQLTAAEGTITTLKTEHATEVSDLKLDAQLKERLGAIAFTSDYAKSGIYADIKSKVTLGEDGQLSGFDEALAERKIAQPKAFVEEPGEAPPPPPKNGGKPHSNNAPPTSPTNLKDALTQKYKV